MIVGLSSPCKASGCVLSQLCRSCWAPLSRCDGPGWYTHLHANYASLQSPELAFCLQRLHHKTNSPRQVPAIIMMSCRPIDQSQIFGVPGGCPIGRQVFDGHSKGFRGSLRPFLFLLGPLSLRGALLMDYIASSLVMTADVVVCCMPSYASQRVSKW